MKIQSDRIGHFIPDGAEHAIRHQQQRPGSKDFYFFSTRKRDGTCNQQWELMLRRILPIKGYWLRFVYSWDRLIPGTKKFYVPSSRTGGRDISGLLAQNPNSVPFTADEDARGNHWLRSLGWQEGEPFITLFVRDSEYLVQSPLHGDCSLEARRVWEYHSYRDSEIRTYTEAIEYLLAQGFWVFRMGQIMGSPANISHPRFIDYAFSPEKSPFLDIWLFARATGVISSPSGPNLLAAVYSRPLLSVNMLPLQDSYGWLENYIFPKTLVWADTRQPLTYQEHIWANFSSTHEYKLHGIEIQDMSPNELSDACAQFVQILRDPSRFEQFFVRERFWQTLASCRNGSPMNNWIHSRAGISRMWLERLPSLPSPSC